MEENLPIEKIAFNILSNNNKCSFRARFRFQNLKCVCLF